jgi:ribosome-associated translation inhibitor RaiA
MYIYEKLQKHELSRGRKRCQGEERNQGEAKVLEAKEVQEVMNMLIEMLKGMITRFLIGRLERAIEKLERKLEKKKEKQQRLMDEHEDPDNW